MPERVRSLASLAAEINRRPFTWPVHLVAADGRGIAGKSTPPRASREPATAHAWLTPGYWFPAGQRSR